MATVCSICGKKQNGFFQDFPLSNNNLKQRICAKYEDDKKNVLRLSEKNKEEYEKAYEYF